jgi:carboxypeptidase Q
MKISTILFVVFTTIFVSFAFAQNNQYYPITDSMRAKATQIFNAALDPSIIDNASSTMSTYNLLAQLCDDYGGRLSGSDNLEAALDWVQQRALADAGKFPFDYKVIVEPVMVPNWRRGTEWVTVSSPFRPTSNQSLAMMGLGMSNNTNGQVITAPLFVVASYQDLMNNAAQAQGKIVLFNYGKWTSYGHDVQYRSNAATWCASVGCKAALIRSVASFGMQTPHTGYSQISTVPSAAISIADCNQLTRQFKRGVQLNISIYM